MKNLLSQIGFPTSVGISISDQTLTVVQLTLTPVGVREGEPETIELRDSELADDLESLLERTVGRARRDRVPVTIGLPESAVYLQTRAINSTIKSPSPQVLLRESMHGSGFQVDRTAVDVVKSQLKRRTVAGIVACESGLVENVLAVLKKTGVKQFRVEPNPCGLLRQAAQQTAKNSGDAVVRVCLGESAGIAALVYQKVPLIWRKFEVVRGDESTGILSAFRSIQTMAPQCGFEEKLDSVIIHGRSELQTLVEFDWLRSEIGVRTTWLDGPLYDQSSTAIGLALSATEEQDARHFDLVRAHKPATTLMSRFPWRTVIYQLLIIASMTFYLIGHYRKVQHDHVDTRAQNSLHPWLGNMQQAELAKRKQDADIQLSSIKRFLDSRVVWTEQLNTVLENLPEELTLTVIEGASPLPANSKKKVKAKKRPKSLIVRGQAPFTPSGSTPPAIGDFVTNLKSADGVQTEFPIVELTSLVRSTARDLDMPVTAFTIELSPKSGKQPK